MRQRSNPLESFRTSNKRASHVQVNLIARDDLVAGDIARRDARETGNGRGGGARSRTHQPRLRLHGNVVAAVPKRRRHRLGRATPRHATVRYAYVTARHAVPVGPSSHGVDSVRTAAASGTEGRHHLSRN